MNSDQMAAALAAQREYKRQWRANNRDKVKAHNAKYWAKKAAEQAEHAQQPAEAPQERD